MSENLIVPVEKTSTPFGRLRRGERGMATVEYALGVVVVIALIGAILVAINTGSFSTLVEELIQAVMRWIGGVFELPLPIKG